MYYYSKPVPTLENASRNNSCDFLLRNDSTNISHLWRKMSASRRFSSFDEEEEEEEEEEWQRRKKEKGVYRSGWKSRHEDEDEDWANNGGSRVRRRLHSSSLTPHNTFAKQARLDSSFLHSFSFSLPFMTFAHGLLAPRHFLHLFSRPFAFFRGSLRLFLSLLLLLLFLFLSCSLSGEGERQAETMCTLALDTDSEAVESTNVTDTRFSQIPFSSYTRNRGIRNKRCRRVLSRVVSFKRWEFCFNSRWKLPTNIFFFPRRDKRIYIYRKRERERERWSLLFFRTMKYCSRNRDTYSRKENKIIGHLKPRNSLFLLYGYNDILDWNEIRMYPTREHKSQIRNPWKSNDI